jgi:hypothetical protein
MPFALTRVSAYQFAEAVRYAPLARISKMARSRGAAASLARTLPKGQLVVVRSPQYLRAANRWHQLYRHLASQAGENQLVPPAIVRMTWGRWKMVMNHVGPGFVCGADAQPVLLRRVPNYTRIVAAVLDFICDHTDRSLRNVMVNHIGEVRLIDPDAAFGLRDWKNRGRKSAFFPGQPLGYIPSPMLWHQLPDGIRELVARLSKLSILAVMSEYNLTRFEATQLQGKTRRILQVGLTRAIAEQTSHRR